MSALISSPLLAVVLVLFILAFLITRRQQSQIEPRIFIFALISIVAFQLLVSIGNATIPSNDAPIIDRILATIALVFGIGTVAQLVQWVVIHYLVRKRYINIPPFFVNFTGSFLTILFALLIIRQFFGLDFTGFLVGSTVITAIVGLSLQEVLGSLFTGFILQIESPFHLGDWVKMGETEGQLVEVHWRTLTLLTSAGNHVILTNNEASKAKITNYSRPTNRQALHTSISVAHTYPPGSVKEVLLATVKNIDAILKEPSPVVWTNNFGGSSIEYIIHYWIDDHAIKPIVQDDVFTRVWYALARAGIGEHFGGSAETSILPAERKKGYRDKIINKIQAALRSFPLLGELNDEQIRTLSQAADLSLYISGEDLVHEGDEGDSLFLVKSGLLNIYIDRDGERDIQVDKRKTGEFFGEMSLLTGQPRSATVTAATEVEVVVIHKAGFVDVLATDPTILDILLDAIEKRQVNLETQSAAADERARQREAERNMLLNKIKGFLGI